MLAYTYRFVCMWGTQKKEHRCFVPWEGCWYSDRNIYKSLQGEDKSIVSRFTTSLCNIFIVPGLSAPTLQINFSGILLQPKSVLNYLPKFASIKNLYKFTQKMLCSNIKIFSVQPHRGLLLFRELWVT